VVLVLRRDGLVGICPPLEEELTTGVGGAEWYPLDHLLFEDVELDKATQGLGLQLLLGGILGVHLLPVGKVSEPRLVTDERLLDHGELAGEVEVKGFPLVAPRAQVEDLLGQHRLLLLVHVERSLALEVHVKVRPLGPEDGDDILTRLILILPGVDEVEDVVGRRFNPLHLLVGDGVSPEEAVAAGLRRVELVEELVLLDCSPGVLCQGQVGDDAEALCD